MVRPKRYLPVQAMLEWAFRNECAEIELPDLRDYEDRGAGFGTEYIMIQRAKLGVTIDGGGPGARESHEDAEAVAAIVSNLPDALGGRQSAIVVAELARSGITPDWMPGAVPKIEPQHWHSRKGIWQAKPEMLRVYFEIQKRPHPRNRSVMVEYRKRHEIWWTPCTWTLEPRTIEAARQEYQTWWKILDYIRDALQMIGTLREHAITDAMPPRRPWANQKDDSRQSASRSPSRQSAAAHDHQTPT